MSRPKPRFLAFGAGGGTGYTSRPLRDYPQVADEPEQVDLIASHSSIRDEPEAIGPGWVSTQNFWVRQQFANLEAARASRPTLDVRARLRDLQRRAKAVRCDVSRESHEITRDLDRARLAGRREPARVLVALERLESRIDELSAGRFPSAA